MGAMSILLVIDDGVYVYIFKVYSSFSKEYTSHVFVYYSHFSQLEKSECCGAIIDNRSYSPILVMKKKDRKRKYVIKNMLRKCFEVTCIVEYVFKVTANYFL